MFDQVVFTEVAGEIQREKVQLLALSTCGFCKRGMDFLKKKQIAFEYVFLDEVETELKVNSKQEFRDKFGINLSYPSLVRNGDRYTLGYIQRFWEEFLDIPHEDETVEAKLLE